MRERDSEKAAGMLAQTRIEVADRDRQRERRSIGQLREEQAMLRQRPCELHKASTAVECVNALKSFETSDLGQTHKSGGTAGHARARFQVLDRIRLITEKASPPRARERLEMV